MNQEKAIEIMKSSTSVHDWNYKRDLVLESLKEEDKEYNHTIKIHALGKVNLRTFIPKWFFEEINCKDLICQVLQK